MEQKIKCHAFTAENKGYANCLKSKVIIYNKEQTVEAVALWDTGATGSCISHELAKHLGLEAIGCRTIRTPSGEKDVSTYLIDVILPNNVVLTSVLACESDIGKQNLGMLIGMDIIGRGDFAVSNYNGKTVFTFRIPSQQMIDFVKQTAVNSVIGQPHSKGRKKKR